MLFFTKHSIHVFSILIIHLSLMPSIVLAKMTLTMQQAEELAVSSDVLMKSHQQYAQAYKHEAVANEQWPDPSVKLGFQALPVDSFDLDQEPMTQLVIGYSQMIPRGDSLLYKSELMQTKSAMKIADKDLRQRQVRLAVRKAWLNVYLQVASEKIVKKNRNLFKQQLEVSQSLYSAGRKQQQDVLQAELELSLIDDKLQQIKAKKNEGREQLAQWVGSEPANYELIWSSDTPTIIFNEQQDELLERIQQHPVVIKHNQKITANHKMLALAEQKYKSQWGFEVNYGKRSGENLDGSDRADFLTGMVKFDIPVFTEDKQDRVISSKKNTLQASKYEKQDKIQFYQSKINRLYVRLENIKTRLYLYDKKVLPQASQNSKAALNGYQSGVISFFALTKASSAELKAQLQRIKLHNEQSLAFSEMRFLIGEK